MNPDVRSEIEEDEIEQGLKRIPERFPCSGCAFEYTVGRGKGEYKGQLVIRKHNSRTGPGLCPGAGVPPRTEEAPAQEDAFSAPAHVHDFRYADDDKGHSGSFCLGCGEEEPDDAGEGSAPRGGLGPWTTASFESDCDGSGCQILEGDRIRSDGMDGWLCESCGEDDETDEDGPGTSPLLAVAAQELARSVATAHGLTQAVDDIVANTLAVPSPPVASSEPSHLFTDLSGVSWIHPRDRDACVLPECVLARTAPITDVQSVSATLPDPAPDPFQAPAKMPDPAPTVSGQPEAERDRWGRYMLPIGKAGKMVGTTRATTFAKSTSDTFNLSQWGDRMVIKGLVLRPDLLALAHGLDVKRDRDALNSIAEQAKEAAGNKVAANFGTALHAFTERLDAGQMMIGQAPPEYQEKLHLYQQAMANAGLRTRPEWIERTTAVTVAGNRSGVQEEVAGTLDRISEFGEASTGDLVIVDLKTGADLSYGWGEIAVQLGLYAHGVNQRGVYDHRTKTWGPIVPDGSGAGLARKVREDFAIVVHLPADPTDGGKHPDRKPWCQLYWIDLREGWEAASLNADVRSWRKSKNLARPLQPEDLAPGGAWNPQEGVVEDAPAPAVSRKEAVLAQADAALEAVRVARARWDNAEAHFRSATSRGALAQLWQYATDCGHFSPDQVKRLTAIGMEQLNLLEASPAG